MAKPGSRGQRSALGIILILGASYAVWTYDTGRFSLLKAALVGPPGLTPLDPGFHPVTPLSGASPQIMPSTPGIIPPGDHPGLPPALPPAVFSPSSWMSNIPQLLRGVFGSSGNSDPLSGSWDSGIPSTPGIAGGQPWTHPAPNSPPL